MMTKLTCNKTCKPHQSSNIESITKRVLNELLNNSIINRKNLEAKGITFDNASLHSMISTLRNRKYIPIESEAQIDGTADYFMLQDEIDRYNDPLQREQQRAQVMDEVDQKRTAKACRTFIKLLNKLKTNSSAEHCCSITATLDLIVNEIATLQKLKGAR